MNELEQKIKAACDSTKPRTRERNKALSEVRWVLAAAVGGGELVYACLRGHKAALTDDPFEAVVFDGRDNEQFKARYYSVLTGCTLEPVLI